jgi:hypothetical protein
VCASSSLVPEIIVVSSADMLKLLALSTTTAHNHTVSARKHRLVCYFHNPLSHQRGQMIQDNRIAQPPSTFPTNGALSFWTYSVSFKIARTCAQRRIHAHKMRVSHILAQSRVMLCFMRVFYERHNSRAAYQSCTMQYWRAYVTRMWSFLNRVTLRKI